MDGQEEVRRRGESIYPSMRVDIISILIDVSGLRHRPTTEPRSKLTDVAIYLKLREIAEEMRFYSSDWRRRLPPRL